MMAANEEERLNVYVVSDRLTPTEGALNLKVMKLDGALISEVSKPLKITANASAKYPIGRRWQPAQGCAAQRSAGGGAADRKIGENV
jgi:hypothetical protein